MRSWRAQGTILELLSVISWQLCHRLMLRIGDFECFDVGRSKPDLGHIIRHGLRIVALEYLIFPRHFVGPREGWVLFRGSFQRIENRESSLDLAGLLLLPVRVMNQEKSKSQRLEKAER